MNRIYYMRTDILEDQTKFDLAISLISESRKATVASQKNRDRKLAALAVSYLLHVACNNADIPKSKRELTANEYGKPQFIADTGVHFSLSHSDNLAVCAVSDSPVGIDTECNIQRNTHIANRFFTEDERQFIMEQPEENRNNAFLKIWTLKESYVKAVGCGFNKSPLSFSVPISKKLCAKLQYNGYYMSEFHIEDNLTAVCAISPDPFDVCEITDI